jgi:hypothetical protein
MNEFSIYNIGNYKTTTQVTKPIIKINIQKGNNLHPLMKQRLEKMGEK